KKNKELREINTRLANIFNTMSDGVITIDKNGIIRELNPVAKKILGFGPGKKAQTTAIQAETVLGPENSIVKNLLLEKKSCVDVELILDANKCIHHCVASGEPVFDEQGAVTGAVIILRPIKLVKNLVHKFSGYHSALQFSDIIGESKGVLEAVRVAALAASSQSNVLLQGESGTGKEIFAQAIHNRSSRREGPFIAVNCGAIPRELVGSELFGYEDGSFTGAKRGGKPGKFELAYGGTLFLDEIADMPLEQQVVLLRALQERKIQRIGGDKTLPVNARVICASNKRLLEEVKKGTFREDLYYRLHVISITIPPLRERAEDIGLLFQHFLDKMNKNSLDFEVKPEVTEKIIKYDWPGNVRELQNVVERIVSLAQGNIITLANLPQEIRNFESTGGKYAKFTKENYFRSVFEENEKQEIFKLLCTYRGNISLVAKNMGVSRNTLYRKMKHYNLK
ncbi:MAG: sigma 54-interacting transcriptional regulator, partial [Sporomusaceae bacterium]|nr:sigma 54-interacting transcriptional regulator [Sporomusaceae bacterium]